MTFFNSEEISDAFGYMTPIMQIFAEARKSALCLGRFLHIFGTKRIKEVFYRQHIDNHKSYCYSRYNISGKQFFRNVTDDMLKEG